MRIVVFGAGAVGGLLGARLASCGEDVVLIARGAHLEAIRSNGLRVRSAVFGEFSCRPQATDRPDEVGPADIVFLTVKAHATRAAAEAITPLLGPRTAVVTAQNASWLQRQPQLRRTLR